ncbi:MAG: hypothetical protein AAGJ18_01885 [Bacteroidota bacterium]
MEDIKELLSISAIFDIRAETLAANLLSHAEGDMKTLSIEQIIIAAKGDAKRRSAKDVAEVKKKYYDHDTALLVEVNRKGLFDTLPDRLFLRLEEPYETPIQRTRAITQQIKEARQFFLPFEQALYHPRIEAEQLEEKWTEGFPDFIKNLWGLSNFEDCLNERQEFLLCYLIPEAYRVVGNWELTGLCFEAVLKKPVNLNFIAPMELEIPNGDKPANECSLGEDTILGDIFRDDMPTLEVCVRGITQYDLEDYLPEGKQRRILEDLLYSYFLPLDVAVQTKILVTDDTWGFTFGESIIGYNVQL